MMKKWNSGKINPWWDQQHRDLDYIYEPFNNPQDVSKWCALGFAPQRFTGDMHDMRFPEPLWVTQFRDVFPMENFCWSVYRMNTGDILPEHGDVYRRYCQLHHITDIQRIKRYIVFLEPWKTGHYFEVDRNPVVGWQAGDWVSWYGDTVHIAANIGSEKRYTLQLTGVDKD